MKYINNHPEREKNKKKMKKSGKFALYCISVLLLAAVLWSCEKEEETKSLKDLGTTAANEFCNCFKNNSKDNCLDKMKSKYNYSDYMTNTFIEAFNKQSSCNVKLQKITTPQ